jgi:hypothetical protein
MAAVIKVYNLTCTYIRRKEKIEREKIPPLVEGIDVPYGALYEDLVLIHGD